MTSVTSLPSRRRLVFTAIALVLALGLLELLSPLVGSLLAPRLDIDMRRTRTIYAEQTARIRTLLDDPTTLILLDSTLGWYYRPGYSSPVHVLNAAGLRSDREYAAVAPPGTRRLAAFGDSFIYGTEVPNADAWPQQLEVREPTLEVLNYGVGGYGTDQAMLRYLRDGSRFAPELVLIGFAPVDLRRTENVYRRFISSHEVPLVKPRFALEPDGRLTLIPNPLPRREDWEALAAEPSRARSLGAHDKWYDPIRYENPVYDWSTTVRLGSQVGLRVWRKFFWRDRLLEGGAFRPAAPAFALQRAILNAFADSVRARGAVPLFVLLPDQESVTGLRSGGRVVYAPMRDSLLRDSRAPVIDLIDAFRARPASEDPWSWFAPGGHYSRAGNAIVAEWIAARLPDEGPRP